MIKRNGFSMPLVTLVGFRDATETILAPATARDAASVVSIYPAVSDELKTVEAEQNDAEIQDTPAAAEASWQRFNWPQDGRGGMKIADAQRRQWAPQP